MTPNEKREITMAQNRVGKEERLFEELTIEGRKWSDQHLWNVAAGWFMKAARKAEDVARAQDALGKLLVAAEMKKESVNS
jgi:hypothetical protein